MSKSDELPQGSNTGRDWGAVLFALSLPTFVTLVYFDWSEGLEAGVRQGIYSVAKVVQFGFPLIWVWWMQRRKVSLWPISTQGVGWGGLFGLTVLIAALGLYQGWLKSSPMLVGAADEIQGKITALGLGSAWKFAALGVFYSLCHSFLEEYYWRWFVFQQLKRLVPVWLAIVISSLGFMAHHVLVVGDFFGTTSPITWLLSAAVAVGGAVWAWLYHRSNSLLGPWLSHLLIDAAIFVIGYDIAKPLFGN